MMAHKCLMACKVSWVGFAARQKNTDRIKLTFWLKTSTTEATIQLASDPGVGRRNPLYSCHE